MKIRNKITLWITAAGLLAGLLFSLVVSIELIEQPYKLLDAELDSQAHAMLAGFAPQDGALVPGTNMAMVDALGWLYWLKIFDEQQTLIYASPLAKKNGLPLRKNSDGYTVNGVAAGDGTVMQQSGTHGLPFRVRVFLIPFAGHQYLVQIARPMEKLQEEISDVVMVIVIGIILYTMILIVAGYFAAGRILRPVTDINALAREINEKTLAKRIPLGENRDELYALSSSLNQMFDRLQFSFRQQKEFIANASHELKTPIAMQRLFFAEVQQRDDLPEEFLDQVEGQLQTLYRMDRLVKNLLDLSALELNETFERTAVNLSRLARSVVEDFQKSIEVAGICLTTEIEDGLILQADGEKIRRMLINLIDNAIKYNSGDTREIRLHLAASAELIHLEIDNSGQPLAPEELSRLFTQFYRVEKSRAQLLGGSGLGLTIVKKIVDLHHGSIEVKNLNPGWIQVQVWLPFKIISA